MDPPVTALSHGLIHGCHNLLVASVVHATVSPLTHALSQSLTSSLIHYYYCTYCFYYNDYCRYCFKYESYQRIHRNYWRGLYKPEPSGDPMKNMGQVQGGMIG